MLVRLEQPLLELTDSRELVVHLTTQLVVARAQVRLLLDQKRDSAFESAEVEGLRLFESVAPLFEIAETADIPDIGRVVASADIVDTVEVAL